MELHLTHGDNTETIKNRKKETSDNQCHINTTRGKQLKMELQPRATSTEMSLRDFFASPQNTSTSTNTERTSTWSNTPPVCTCSLRPLEVEIINPVEQVDHHEGEGEDDPGVVVYVVGVLHVTAVYGAEDFSDGG